MDRNPSPPSSDAEDEQAAGDSIGNTVYSKHWLFSILTKLIEVISPEKSDSNSNREEVQTELDEEMENDICKMWDMSMDEDVALFLQEFNAPDIFMGVFAKSKCPRLINNSVKLHIVTFIYRQILLQHLCDSDSPTLLETSRLLLTCLSQAEVANIWVERIRENPSVYDCVCFIMSSSTNVELLVKVGEVVDKLFDLDEELMLNWIKHGSCQSVGQSTDDSPEEHPDFKIVPCVLEAAKQVCSDNPEGLDVYMHILQLLTTVDEGIQAIDMPLIGSLIRILQNMEDCGKRSFDNSKKSQPEETKKSGTVEEDFHLKILKDICCELLSNMLQELTKVESFLEALREADQTLADSLEKRFPSLRLQT
ncbi:Protein SAAL1 [Chelonia mydas]|uniref:Protein SAAL1 n=1 Tax=Chelonia mydas TaxID=8469 RepID=M7BRC1_CHEMY|nr:Protein SAAL1 [Chelonia mydas]